MPTFKLTLEYDGTDFEGWQVQAAGRRTVQGALEEAISRVTGARAAVTGAGRTDAGVHAQGQVASAAFETRLGPAELQRALNAVLPADVAVIHLAAAPDGFDARRHARWKVYRYAIWNGPARSPLRERTHLRVGSALDLAAMREAAAALVGTHDFASFRATGSPVASTVRTLARIEVRGAGHGEVAIEVQGSGFLRHMVRALAGTLIEVGTGKRAAASMPGVLAARRRPAAGPTAAARGLALVRVEYGADPAPLDGPIP